MTVRTLLALEVRVQWRYGVAALVGALTLAWTALLLALPPAGARAAAPWVLLLETALLGTTVVGALVLLERDLGMRAALAVAPARLGARLAAKVGVLALLVAGSAVPIALAGRPVSPGGLAMALVGVALTAVLTMLVAVAVAAHRQSVITFMITLPLVLLPLLLPPLAHAAGLSHPVLYAVPTTGAVDLIWAGYDHAGTTGGPSNPGWLVVWLGLACLVAAAVAHHQLRRPEPARTSRTATATATAAARPSRPSRGPVRAFVRTDLASLRRDPLLILIAVSPVLLGLALRFGYSPAQAWLTDQSGFDLTPYRPLLLAVAILLHVPVTFGMIGALLVLDDVDDRALAALRTSPLTLPRYLGYRAGLVTVAAWAGLAVAVPLSGLAAIGPGLGSAMLLAGLVAPLFMLATLAVASNKVTGVAAVKLLGLPAYAPVAAWWLPGPAGWGLALLPTWWVLQALWTGWPYALGGAAVTAAGLVLLTRRVLTRLASA